ncbi:MAG: phosphoribosylaminoimidazolecarboxamide formyltransferase [Oscillospiraceae bacterium]|nr:phosphoribosylaminoimidazolecarboxamide formyltransferase [Oscillospiraceae bacterium]
MKELELKYGCNPNQTGARIFMDNGELPLEILNHKPGYINLLDAFNAWQLVKELKEATGLASATSFKHVSPAGAAVAEPLDDVLKKAYFAENIELTDVSTAYIRARGADRVASYGDLIALSDECDESTALYLKTENSDGIIAPSYSDKALEILKTKRNGTYLIMKIDKDYEPRLIERKDVYGITFEQSRNNIKIDKSLFENIPTNNKSVTDKVIRDMIVALITLKYTQSNSVCYVKDGQAIGVGAGQQARLHCTRVAGNKADLWYLRGHEKVLNLPFIDGMRNLEKDNAIDAYLFDVYDDWENLFKYKPEPFSAEEKANWIKNMNEVVLGSDAFFPFGDNVERAYKSGVKYIAQPGGSIRDDNVIDVCNKYGIFMAFTGIRLFHH